MNEAKSISALVQDTPSKDSYEQEQINRAENAKVIQRNIIEFTDSYWPKIYINPQSGKRLLLNIGENKFIFPLDVDRQFVEEAIREDAKLDLAADVRLRRILDFYFKTKN